MVAVALALGSSLSWGVADFLGGLQARRRPLLAVLVVTQAAGLAVIGIAVAARGEAPPDGSGWVAWAALGSVCGIGGLTALYRGLATGAMGVVAPISSTAAVIPLVVGIAGGERPSGLQVAGAVVAIGGVVLASREEGSAGTGVRMAAGASLGIAAAVGFGGLFVGIDEASKADTLWAVLVARLISIAAVLVAAAATRTAVPRPARDLAELAPIGLLDTGANLLFALATTQGLVSVVAVLASLYPVVTVLLARFALDERLHVLQRAGAVGALAGAAMISAG